MKNFKKTALAVVLAVAMLIPSISFAADPNQAKIGDMEYATIDDAVANVKAGETITLLENVTRPKSVVVNSDFAFTIDLNGKTLKRSIEETEQSKKSGYPGILIQSGDLTVKDSVGGGKIITEVTGTAPFTKVEPIGVRLDSFNAPKKNTKFTLQSGIISVSGGANVSVGVSVQGNGNAGSAIFNMTGGTIDATHPKGAYAVAGNGSAGIGGTVINISGGTLKSNEIGIYHPQDGVLNVSGGTINGITGGIGMKRGTLNMTGGTINVTGPKSTPVAKGSGMDGTGAPIQLENILAGTMKLNISGNNTKLISANGNAIDAYGTDGNNKITEFKVQDATIKGDIVLSEGVINDILNLGESNVLIHNVKSTSKPANIGNDFVAVEQEDGTFAIVQKRYMSQVTGYGEFDELIVGYANAPQKDFTITNMGNNALSNIAVSLKGKNAADFQLTAVEPAGELSIGKTASFSVKPKTGLKAGYYSATVVVSADKMDDKEIPVSIVIAENTYFARVSGSGNLGELIVGYANAPKRDFTITNTGNSPLKNLKASLTGANAADFELTAITPVGDLAVDTTASFTLQAKTGLKAGYYSAMIVVSAEGMSDMEIPVSMGVKAGTTTDAPNVDGPNVDEPNIEKPGSDVTVNDPNAPVFVEQTKTEAKKDEITSPKTGDNAARMLIAVVAMGTAAVGIIALGALKKKAHNK